jgi:hypothetical protein
MRRLPSAICPGQLALLGRLIPWFFAAWGLGACGSRRLETALEPLGDTGGSAGIAGTSSGFAAAGMTFAGTGGTGDAQPGGDAGAAGSPGPLATEPLVTLAEFGESYMVGPVASERFQVSDQPFSEAWRATMSEPPSSPWIAQLVVPLNEPVQAGQLLHVTFWLKCEVVGVNGDCYTEYIFERASDPWEKSVTFVEHAGAGWSQKSEYFSVVNSYAAGESHMVFRLGYVAQVIAIGGLELEAIDPLP